MKTHPIVKIDWKGGKTAAAARTAIDRRLNVELNLPANYHHALSAQLYPESEPTRPPIIDVTGGAELLFEIARINGLVEITGLAQAASEASARVQVLSPSPKVAITFPTPDE
jgi:YbbR domain-containing protein